MADPHWKVFEKLTTQVIKTLDPKAVVTFDDKLTDKTTGKTRQVDCTVRSHVSSFPVLILVSCKDYKKPVDVTEVETLASQVRDYGASRGVIVSNGGFTDGAVAKALFYNTIDLCNLFDAENKDWSANLTIPVLHIFQRCQFRSEIKNESGTDFNLPPLDLAQFEDGQRLTSIFTLFCALWRDKKLDQSVGTHTYSYPTSLQVLVGDQKYRVSVIFEYIVGKELFFQDLPVPHGKGLINKTNGFALKDFSQLQTDWISVDEPPTGSIKIDSINEAPRKPAMTMERILAPKPPPQVWDSQNWVVPLLPY